MSRPRLPVSDPKVAKRRAGWRKRSARYYKLNRELVCERRVWAREDAKESPCRTTSS